MKSNTNKRRGLLLLLIDVLAMLSFSYFPDYIISPAVFSAYRLIIYTMIILFILSQKKYRQRMELKKIFVIAFIYLVPLIATLLYWQDIQCLARGARQLMGVVALMMYFFMRIKSSKPEIFVRNTVITWGILILINMVTMFAFSSSGMFGQANYYFLGNDNGSVFESFMFVLFSAMYFIYSKKKVPVVMWASYLVILFSYVYLNSSNASVGIAALLIAVAISKCRAGKIVANPKALLSIYALFFLVIVIWRSDANIITQVLNLLGRDSTFTGRTYIWDRSMKWIAQYPVLGVGYEPEASTVLKLTTVKCHNFLIQMLYNGGWLSLIASAAIALRAYLHVDGSNVRVRNLVVLSGFIFLIITTFDFYQLKYAPIFMLLALYIPRFCGKKEKTI